MVKQHLQAAEPKQHADSIAKHPRIAPMTVTQGKDGRAKNRITFSNTKIFYRKNKKRMKA
jgi:hypothetical protein